MRNKWAWWKVVVVVVVGLVVLVGCLLIVQDPTNLRKIIGYVFTTPPNYERHQYSEKLIKFWVPEYRELSFFRFFDDGTCTYINKDTAPPGRIAFEPCVYSLMQGNIIRVIHWPFVVKKYRYSFSDDFRELFLTEQFGDNETFKFIIEPEM